MELWQALVLGLVEGITEFLPVSSTGHLLVTQRLLGLAQTEASHAYAICIQAGAIAAVLALYTRRLRQVGAGVLGRDQEGARLALALLLAFLPAAVAGLLLDEPIERLLFGPWPVVVAWFVGGVVILALARRGTPRITPLTGSRAQAGSEAGPQSGAASRTAADGAPRSIFSLTPSQALLIGLAQTLALWPGTSRSLVTILAAGLVGLSLPAAIEFSFLLGLLTLGAATAYKLLQHGQDMLEAYGPASLLVGFVAACLSALVAVRWMVGYLARHDLRIFAWWRIAAAALVAGLLLANVL